MSVGSHKDAFLAHQMVKKLSKGKSSPVLASLAADILLHFVQNGRQVDSDFVVENLPFDKTQYDETYLDNALKSVGGLCMKCDEHHNNACFINQTRRILIAAKTQIDLGSDFDGNKSLEMLLQEALSLAQKTNNIKKSYNKALKKEVLVGNNIPNTYLELKEEYISLKEHQIFQASLIDEILQTIESVSNGNMEAEMPVHDDPQLGQLAKAFNIMLATINKTMNHLDSLVAERTKELNIANTALQNSLEKVEAANVKIMDGINYAKVIQTSLLTSLDRVKTYLPESFFLWMPRDVVGGDIFYTESFDDGFIIAVADCTGHGVPGAFMTMIAFSGLKRIVYDEGCYDPAMILKKLNMIVKTSLQQDTDHALSDDGLDAAVCFVDSKKRTLKFAGARLSLFYTFANQLKEIKGDRQSIGYKRSDLNFKFSTHTISIQNNMAFYMATDGFTDQFGGPKERRFGKKRFKKLILENSYHNFENQRKIFLDVFNEHKGENEMIDDVTVVGFSIK